MSDDYTDYRVWKEVELYTKAEYLSEYEEYQPEDILEISSKLLFAAKEEGLEGCYMKFESTMTPHESYLGPVQVIVCGYRKLNSVEKAEHKKQDAIKALAQELGVSFYEAATVFSLKEKGKI